MIHKILLKIFAAAFVVLILSNQIYPSSYTRAKSFASSIVYEKVDDKDFSVLFHGSRQKKQIALTFDADMTNNMKVMLEDGKINSWFNKKIIDTLIKTHTKATLFLTGMWIETYKKETEDLAKNSLFELGNHTYSHPSFNDNCYRLQQIKSDSEKTLEITKTQKILKDITHKQNMLFRFPGGCYSAHDLNIVTKQKLQIIQWDVVSKDAFTHDANAIISRVLNRSQNGSIVVMHLNGGPNASSTDDALPLIIQGLKKKGFTFVTISELLSNS